MGRDKALLQYHGKTQIEYGLELLQKFCPQVYLSKREDQKSYPQVPSIHDRTEFAEKGPLGGILSAMKEHPGASWLVLACDLPKVTEETLRYLLAHRDPSKTATAFIGSMDSLPEPLCAVWEGHAWEGILKLFNAGVYCPRKVLIKSDTCLLKAPDPHWLDNINTSTTPGVMIDHHNPGGCDGLS